MSTIQKFRKKPVIVTAVQYSKRRHLAGERLPDGLERRYVIDEDGAEEEGYPHMKTANGYVIINDGDWIVTSPDGDRWPVAKRIFDRTYEPVEDSTHD